MEKSSLFQQKKFATSLAFLLRILREDQYDSIWSASKKMKKVGTELEPLGFEDEACRSAKNCRGYGNPIKFQVKMKVFKNLIAFFKVLLLIFTITTKRVGRFIYLFEQAKICHFFARV